MLPFTVLYTDTNSSTSTFRLNFSVDDQKSIFACAVFNLIFRYGWAHAFLWTTKFWSGQVNLKSYLPSWATKVCRAVCTTVLPCMSQY